MDGGFGASTTLQQLQSRLITPPMRPQIAMAVADEQLQPVLPASLPASLLVVCHACCDFDPGMRPSFMMVVEELTAAIQEIKQQVCVVGGGRRVWEGGLLLEKGRGGAVWSAVGFGCVKGFKALNA